jgi:ParB-like chromosome segregation protein Spo0J
MKVQELPLDKLIPYARNPRKNETAITKVAASLKEFGWRQPIVVDPEHVIIAGHTRYEAAKRLGWNKAPVHVAEGLTPAQVKAYRIADNRTGQEAEWDMELLKLELEDLKGLDFDSALTGFDPFELKHLSPKDVPNVQAEPVPLEEVWGVIVNCDTEDEQVRLLERLSVEGYRVKALLC